MENGIGYLLQADLVVAFSKDHLHSICPEPRGNGGMGAGEKIFGESVNLVSTL